MIASRASASAALLLLAAASAPRAARADEWAPVSDKDGVRVERRPVPGSRYDELRLTAHSPLPPARVAASIWADRRDGAYTSRHRRSHLVLADQGDEVLFYERIATPVVKDRDYVVRFRRGGDPATGSFRIEFHIDESGAGPPPSPECVRARDIWGSWTVTRSADGGSDIVYITHSDPGGAVPAFLARGPQLEANRAQVLEVLDWARSHPAQAMR